MPCCRLTEREVHAETLVERGVPNPEHDELQVQLLRPDRQRRCSNDRHKRVFALQIEHCCVRQVPS